MFTPRLEIPPKDNRYYIAKSEGGLNPCIAKPSGSTLRFANCVFYAVGRYAEITGIWLPSTNAENFVNEAKKLGLIVSDKPQPGAVIVWAKGNQTQPGGTRGFATSSRITMVPRPSAFSLKVPSCPCSVTHSITNVTQFVWQAVDFFNSCR